MAQIFVPTANVKNFKTIKNFIDPSINDIFMINYECSRKQKEISLLIPVTMTTSAIKCIEMVWSTLMIQIHYNVAKQ